MKSKFRKTALRPLASGSHRKTRIFNILALVMVISLLIPATLAFAGPEDKVCPEGTVLDGTTGQCVPVIGATVGNSNNGDQKPPPPPLDGKPPGHEYDEDGNWDSDHGECFGAWCYNYADAHTVAESHIDGFTLEGVPNTIILTPGQVKAYNGQIVVDVTNKAFAEAFGLADGETPWWWFGTDMHNHVDSILSVEVGGAVGFVVLDENGNPMSTDVKMEVQSDYIPFWLNKDDGWDSPAILYNSIGVGMNELIIPVTVFADGSSSTITIKAGAYTWANAFADMLGQSTIEVFGYPVWDLCNTYASAWSETWDKEFIEWLIRVLIKLLRPPDGRITTYDLIYHPPQDEVPPPDQYAYQVLKFECAGTHGACTNNIDTGHEKLRPLDEPYPGPSAVFDNRTRGCEWVGRWTGSGGFVPAAFYCRADTAVGKQYHRWQDGDQVLQDGGFYWVPKAMAVPIWDAYVALDAETGESVVRINEQGMAIMLILEKLGRAPSLEEAKDMVELAILVAPSTLMQ